MAAAGLLGFAAAGLPGMSIYLGLVLVVHLRANTTNAMNMMEVLLANHERALNQKWNAFVAATNRRALVAPARPPPAFVAVPLFMALLVSVAVLGADVSVLARLAIALSSAAAMWLALFGRSRRTTIVFGADGVRIRGTFVAHATVTGVTRRDGRVVLHRTHPLADVVIETDDETAERIVALLEMERVRALQRLRAMEEERPLPAAGFREHASVVGWRVRVSEAASEDERRVVLARVAPEDLRELLDETADPSLEGDVRALLEARPAPRK